MTCPGKKAQALGKAHCPALLPGVLLMNLSACVGRSGHFELSSISMHRGGQERPTGYFKDKSCLGKRSRFSALRKSWGKALSQLSFIYAFQGRWKQVAMGWKNKPCQVLITGKPDNWEGEGPRRTNRVPRA